MRVVVREAFKAYINHQPEDFHVGQKIKGDTAVLLLRRCAAVDPEDDEARELADLLDDSKDDEDQEQEPPRTPATPEVVPIDVQGDGANGGPPPGPPGELDIDATVADVLAWVGEDTSRAQEALTQEQAKDHPRSTLVKQLTPIAGADGQ